MDDAQGSADLLKLSARSIAQLRHHALRREIKIRAREGGAHPARRQIEFAAAGIEAVQIFGQQQPPS